MMRLALSGSRRRPLFAVLACLWLAGCLGRSPDVRLFTLGTQAPLESSARAPELAVLVGPVRVPAYLERPQIVRRKAFGEIEIDEFNRWVGGFEANLIRAVTEGVRHQLGSVRVVGYPSQAPFAMDYAVRIHVDELILDASNTLQMRVRWAITPGAEGGDATLGSLERAISSRNRSVEALVEVHDRALSELAQQIADQLVAESTGP